MAKKALIVQGGWEGHDPVKISEIFSNLLKEEGFDVEISDTLDSFKDSKKLMGLDLIIPHWTMGVITQEQLQPVLNAVASGVGIAGCHGGMCDAFHDSVDWQFMTGGQWVAHPGGDGTEYTVNIKKCSSPIVEGIEDFKTVSEQYYMHVDPAVNVLATTRFPVGDAPFKPCESAELEPGSGFGTWNFEAWGVKGGPHVGNNVVDMPVMWTKYFGKGRVFYSSLGHVAKNILEEPTLTLMRRGFLWAAKLL
ncbi:MAG: ThuA domain-containing protein [Acetivibrionales bacterium]|jgi:type 1 glutamine amidotransferase